MRIDIRFEIVANFVRQAKTQQSNAAYVKSVSPKNETNDFDADFLRGLVLPHNAI